MPPPVEVITAGHLCLDLLPQMGTVPLSALASPGKLFEVGALGLSTGGAVANTGLALHKLGLRVALAADVGDDLLGELVMQRLRDQGSDLDHAVQRVPGQHTSYSVVLAPGGSDRIFLHAPGANAHFDGSRLTDSTLRGARLLHLGYPPLLPALTADGGAPLAALFQRAKALGVLTSLDMAHPDPDGPSGRVDWPRVLARTLPHVDLFVPSIEEIIFMLRRADYDAWRGDVMPHLTRGYLRRLADSLLDMGVCIVGFKLGAMGMYLRGGRCAWERLGRIGGQAAARVGPAAWVDYEGWHPAYAVDVVGSTGAGDCAYAGLIAALLRGLPPDDVLRTACAVGACNVEAADAISGVLPWDAVQARIESGWATHALTLPDS